MSKVSEFVDNQKPVKPDPADYEGSIGMYERAMYQYNEDLIYGIRFKKW